MTKRDVILAIIRYRLLPVELAAKLLGGKPGATDKLLRELETAGVLQSQVIAGREKSLFPLRRHLPGRGLALPAV